MTSPHRHIVVFGGTFDPIHHGHLRSAIELKELLGADELRLMPSHRPPLRGEPGASSQQRLTMVQAAVEGEPGLRVDDRELGRDAASYTVESLRDLRAELGEAVTLTMVVGSDAYARLQHWQQWSSLLDYAHLLVLERADYPLEAAPEVAMAMNARRVSHVADLASEPAGKFASVRLRQLPISATDIRERVACGRSIRYLLPDVVAAHIARWGLYQTK